MDYDATLPKPPGAKAAFHCGVWSLPAAILCFPVAILLGIFAIVNHAKAKRAAQGQPEAYQAPGSGGLVMGIVGLCLSGFAPFYIGIVSAIAIPALLSQRGRARDKAAIQNLSSTAGDLVGKCDELASQGRTPAEVKAELESFLRAHHAGEKNPWNPQAPAYAATVTLAEGVEAPAAADALAAMPSTLGQCAFAYQAPTPGHAGWVGGWVELSNPVNQSKHFVKVIALE